MTRYISPENQAALEQRTLVARDFLTIIARDRVTSAPVTECTWSDVGTYTAPVINPNTGLEVTRTFAGAGGLVEISTIPLISNLSVQEVTIKLNQVNERVEQLIRLYDVQQARVEIHRGLFDPDTRLLVAPAFARFVGFVDEVTIITPEEGGSGYVELRCKSHTQEITRSNPDTRSHESQKRRLTNDTMYKDTSTAMEWEIFWGSIKGKVQTAPKRKKFLGLF